MRVVLLTLAVAAGFAAATAPAPAGEGSCSATHLSAVLPAQKLPRAVASTRQRIASAAVACDFEKLERIGKERGSFTFGGERSAATYWRAQERKGKRPLAILVKILGLPVTHNEVGAFAWPSAYTTHPKPADWDAVVRAGLVTRA